MNPHSLHPQPRNGLSSFHTSLGTDILPVCRKQDPDSGVLGELGVRASSSLPYRGRNAKCGVQR